MVLDSVQISKDQAPCEVLKSVNSARFKDPMLLDSTWRSKTRIKFFICAQFAPGSSAKTNHTVAVSELFDLSKTDRDLPLSLAQGSSQSYVVRSTDPQQTSSTLSYSVRSKDLQLIPSTLFRDKFNFSKQQKPYSVEFDVGILSKHQKYHGAQIDAGL